MDRTERKMLRDLDNLRDASEASSSFSDPKIGKRSNLIANHTRMGIFEDEKEMKNNITEQSGVTNKPSNMPNYCLPGRLYCLCKECQIEKAKCSAGEMKCTKCSAECGTKCTWKWKLCKYWEEKFKDYVAPRANSYIQFNSVPTGIVDTTKRWGKDLHDAIMDLIVDVIGGEADATLKKVVTIDADECGKGDSDKDIIVYLADEKIAKEMSDYVTMSGGIMYYAGIEISIQVKFLNPIIDEEGNNPDEENNEGNILFDELVESTEDDSFSEEDYPSDPSDSEDDSSSDSEKSDKAFQLDRSGEYEGSDDDFDVDESDENEENEFENEASVKLSEKANAIPKKNYKKFLENMKENIDPKWKNDSDQLDSDNAALEDDSSGEYGEDSSGDDGQPQPKKPRFSA